MGEERDSASAGLSRRQLMRGAGVAAGVAVVTGGGGVLLGADEAEAATEIPGEGHISLSEVDPNELVEPGEVEGDTTAGVVVATSPHSLLVSPKEEPPITVNVRPNASLTIEGRVPLSAYEVGDEVIAVGERQDNEFVAKGITVVFRIKEATILSRRGRLLQTSEGEIFLLPWVMWEGGMWGDKRYRGVSPDKLKPGDEILAVGMVNQRTGRMNANTVAVPASGESLLGP